MFTAEQLKTEYVEVRDLYRKKKEEITDLRQKICDAEAEVSRLSDWLVEVGKRYDSEYGCDAGIGTYYLSTIIKNEEESSDE